MLGLLMTTVFFYAAIRFSNLKEKQEETIEHKSQKAFFDSYIDYLNANPSEIDDETEENEDGITNIDITLTQIVNEITGVVDSYGEATQVTYADISGDANEEIKVRVEYNLCENNGQTEFANIKTDPAYTMSPTAQSCTSFDYSNYALVTLAKDDDLVLTSLDVPFHYKITGTDLKDTKWHLDAGMRFGFNKRLKYNAVFYN